MSDNTKRRAWAFIVYPDADFDVDDICSAIDDASALSVVAFA